VKETKNITFLALREQCMHDCRMCDERNCQIWGWLKTTPRKPHSKPVWPDITCDCGHIQSVRWKKCRNCGGGMEQAKISAGVENETPLANIDDFMERRCESCGQANIVHKDRCCMCEAII